MEELKPKNYIPALRAGLLSATATSSLYAALHIFGENKSVNNNIIRFSEESLGRGINKAASDKFMLPVAVTLGSFVFFDRMMRVDRSGHANDRGR